MGADTRADDDRSRQRGDQSVEPEPIAIGC